MVDLSRRRFLKAGVAACAASGSVAGCSDTASADTPAGQGGPVLLVIADDLGTELGCYGNASVVTPHIDELARGGTVFLNHFANVSSCSPARSVIFTGLYSHQTGQYGLSNHPSNFQGFSSLSSLPAECVAAGIPSQSIGKFHLRPREVYPFDSVLEGFDSGRDVLAMAAAAGNFMRAHAGNRFFLTVSFVDPHRDDAGGFSNSRAYPGVTPVVYSPDRIELPSHLDDTPENRADVADYYQAISRLDQGVGYLREVIRDVGLQDDILILFVSDNGSAFLNGKTNLYEGGIRVPLIINAPSWGDGGVQNVGLVGQRNLAPTIRQWLGLPTGPAGAGLSLLPILDTADPGEGWTQTFASHSFHNLEQYYPMRMLRTSQYKLIHNLNFRSLFPLSVDVRQSRMWQRLILGGLSQLAGRSLQQYFFRPEFELYDLESDPRELNNLANRSEYADLFGQMRRNLRSWMDSTSDPWRSLLGANAETQRALGSPR